MPLAWLPDAFQACSPCTRLSTVELDGGEDALANFVKREAPAHSGLALLCEKESEGVRYANALSSHLPTLLVRGEMSCIVPRHIIILCDGGGGQPEQQGGTQCLPIVQWALTNLLRLGDEVYVAHANPCPDEPAALATMQWISVSRDDLIAAGHRPSCVHPMLIKSDALTGAVQGAIVDVLHSQQPSPFTIAVCGSHSRRSLFQELVLGSVAAHLTAHSPVPVLLVPPAALHHQPAASAGPEPMRQ